MINAQFLYQTVSKNKIQNPHRLFKFKERNKTQTIPLLFGLSRAYMDVIRFRVKPVSTSLSIGRKTCPTDLEYKPRYVVLEPTLFYAVPCPHF